MANPPFAHQLRLWREEREARGRCTFWEQGTGKTKFVIDQIMWLRMHGLLDGVIVVAPNGVHRNFIVEEWRKHWVPAAGRCDCLWFQATKAGSLRYQEEVDRLLASDFPVFAMSYDSLLQDDRKHSSGRELPGGRTIAGTLLRSRRIMMVFDEAGRVKNPSAKRTRLALKAAQLAAYVRVLNGTPVSNSPFDVYTQVMLADPDFWKRRGINSHDGFCTQYGQWSTGYAPSPHGARKFPKLDSYRNLDDLQKALSEIGSRVLKEDVLDLPPKLYTRRVFDLSPAQRRIYEQLRQDSIAWLDGTEGSGSKVSATLAIVRMGRLQQITCGYVPVDGEEPSDPVDIDPENPRIALLLELAEDIPHKAIVWARYRADIDRIMAAFEKAGLSAVRYDGSCDDEQRGEAIERFQRGDARFFVANPAAAATGLTLHAARTVIYYSNSFSLDQRLQSEDRAHRIGQEHPVNYIDIVAAETVDEHVQRVLRSKIDVAGVVTGDSLREWLEYGAVDRPASED